MFIPNKTYHAIKLGVVSLIAILVLIIVAESVLYFKLLREQNTNLTALTARLDSLSIASTKIDKNSVNRDTQVQSQITDAVTQIQDLQSQLVTSNNTIKVLVSNECTVRPYYMDKRLLEMCTP